MFVEKENYYFIEEFEKLGIKAVYTKKNAGNMSDYCPLENQVRGIQKENRKNRSNPYYRTKRDRKHARLLLGKLYGNGPVRI